MAGLSEAAKDRNDAPTVSASSVALRRTRADNVLEMEVRLEMEWQDRKEQNLLSYSGIRRRLGKCIRLRDFALTSVQPQE